MGGEAGDHQRQATQRALLAGLYELRRLGYQMKNRPMRADDPDPDSQPAFNHVGCQATAEAPYDTRCTEWVREFENQARAVAGGGAVLGRVAFAGPVAARAVSERAAESFGGRHRCLQARPEHTDPHFCRCGHQWPSRPPLPEPSD